MADLKSSDLTAKYLKAVFDNLDAAAKAVQQKGQSQVANLVKAAGYVKRILEIHGSIDIRTQNAEGWAVPYSILQGDPDGIYAAAWTPLKNKYKWVKDTILPHYHVTSIPVIKAKFVSTNSIVLMTYVGLATNAAAAEQQGQPAQDSFSQDPVTTAVNSGIDNAGTDLPDETPPVNSCAAGSIWNVDRGECLPEGITPFRLWLSDYKTSLIVAGVAGALTLGVVVYGLKRKRNPGAGGKDWEEAWQRLQEAWDYHLSGDDKAHVRLRLAEARIHAKRLPQGMRDTVLKKVDELKRQI